jgi:hypothetical protein
MQIICYDMDKNRILLIPSPNSIPGPVLQVEKASI